MISVDKLGLVIKTALSDIKRLVETHTERDKMAIVHVVWHDMIDDKDKESSVEFERHRENCTLISRANGILIFKDEEGEEFNITEEQLIRMI